MSDSRESEIDNLNAKDVECVDSDKSFESCINSLNEEINNIIIKDNKLEEPFVSSLDINNTIIVSKDLKNSLVNDYYEENQHDQFNNNIISSCSEDEISSWDAHWIYDAEYIEQSMNTNVLHKTVLTEEDLKSCEKDLEYIIENHVSKLNNSVYHGKHIIEENTINDNEENDIIEVKNKLDDINIIEESFHPLNDKAINQNSKTELIYKYGGNVSTKLKSQNKSKSRVVSKYKRKRYGYQEYPYYNNYYDDYNYYYYNNSNRYYDYGFYGYQNNSWNPKNSSFNRYYKPNMLTKSKPSKKTLNMSNKFYKKNDHNTDIKNTVNRNNAPLHIDNMNHMSKKQFKSSRTYRNSNYHHRTMVDIEKRQQKSMFLNQPIKYNQTENRHLFYNRKLETQSSKLKPDSFYHSSGETIKKSLSQGDSLFDRPHQSESQKPILEQKVITELQDLEKNRSIKTKEISHGQTKTVNTHIAAPRFLRDKTVTQNRVQSAIFLPKPFSDVCYNQNPSEPVIPEVVTRSGEFFNYPQAISNLDIYGNFHSLLHNLNPGSLKSSNSFSSIHTQMMPLSSFMPSTAYRENHPVYFHPFFLSLNDSLRAPLPSTFISQPQIPVYPHHPLPMFSSSKITKFDIIQNRESLD